MLIVPGVPRAEVGPHLHLFPCIETSAEPSLQAKQLKLKRARLADDLNEKIAQRPGPMELVEKNILPVESSLKEAIIGEAMPGTVGRRISGFVAFGLSAQPEEPRYRMSLRSVSWGQCQ